MVKAKNTTGTAKAKEANVLEVTAKDGEDRETLLARLALEPGTRHATLGSNFAAGMFSDGHQTPISASALIFGDAMAKARAGDKALASDLLAAHVLAQSNQNFRTLGIPQRESSTALIGIR